MPELHRKGGETWYREGEAWRMLDAPITVRYYDHECFGGRDLYGVAGKRHKWCLISPDGVHASGVEDPDAIFALGREAALAWADRESKRAALLLEEALRVKRAFIRR